MTLAGRLPSTRWSLVLRAGETSGDSSVRRVARQSLEELCEIYWPALYGYLRRRGRSRQDAEDLIQGFFANLLERESIAAADASRGRFRAFLYTSLDHYAANEHRREHALKRGGGAATFSIDCGSLDDVDRSFSADALADQAGDPATLFDRQWALCLIRQTLVELERDYQAKGKGEWFAKLSPMLTSTDADGPSRQQIASELGLSATALKVAIHRLRATYRQRLLDAVAQTVENPADTGRERQCLFDALGE
ncbi:sigma-70 family RNA polymerase sigma factor [Stieleria sp. ICT_E10.1]|uniref:RNA polymerase sigma factor n=1 Tax=Stieleria sedimenti TaxID=2976331 RepID=UPI0021805123|nr:sigma-70 family RNA polymerase sigma factor [Stieleria sedimenti]MCS7468195.1 sigma-70 family RNA polymerase sigma factor [Stieleria sedimenti]